MSRYRSQIKYCIITYYEKNIFKNKFPDLMKLLNHFNGKLYNLYELKQNIKENDLDLIHINITKKDINLINIIYGLIGKNSKTKIIATNFYPINKWSKIKEKYSSNIIFRSKIYNADVILCNDKKQKYLLDKIMQRKIYIINSNDPNHVRNKILNSIYNETYDKRFLTENHIKNIIKNDNYINLKNEFNKITLITTCMNRNNFLKQSLPTWLIFSFREIIIVDWSSKKPVINILKEFKTNQKIKIIRINNKHFFNPSAAKNIGARTCMSRYMLFVDSDVKLNKTFIDNIYINQKTFYHGYWKISDPSTTGTFLILKEMFKQINGYNEYMHYWGNEDLDIYTRLRLSGFNSKYFEKNKFHHIDHSDELRLKHMNQQNKSKSEGNISNKEMENWTEYHKQEKLIASIYYPDGFVEKDILI